VLAYFGAEWLGLKGDHRAMGGVVRLLVLVAVVLVPFRFFWWLKRHLEPSEPVARVDTERHD